MKGVVFEFSIYSLSKKIAFIQVLLKFAVIIVRQLCHDNFIEVSQMYDVKTKTFKLSRFMRLTFILAVKSVY